MKPISRRRFLQDAALAASSVTIAHAALAQSTSVDAHIDIAPAETIGTIAPEIYSHFIEQLGGVVYDGVWVGEKSKIPNHKGIRQDFINAMKEIEAPVLRWPGGCFADSYDWRDGLGPADKRPNRTAFWGQQESNRYGLHEFIETCRAIGCKPYLAADIRSQEAKDFYQLVEYCNAPSGNLPSNSAMPVAPDTLAAERAANGSPDPFNVQYWGVGNESWGCGGNMTPEEYAAAFRRYTAWLPGYGKEPLKLVAVGPNGNDLDWTRRMFKALSEKGEQRDVWGLSCHYYTSGSPSKFAQGDALNFNEADHYDLLARGSVMERIITGHYAIATAQGGQKQIKLVVDEWGAWYGKGTEIGPNYNLSQQSTMRDALLTGITLDIFQRHADKVGMANLAQTINCIHSLMLAKEDKFTLTPTFHVFKMYMPHKGATAIRAEFAASSIVNPLAVGPNAISGNDYSGSGDPERKLAGLSGSASIKGKELTLTVVNPHLTQAQTTEINIRSGSITSVKGTVLAGKDVHDHNDFSNTNAVHPVAATGNQPSGGRLIHTFPPASVTTLQFTLS